VLATVHGMESEGRGGSRMTYTANVPRWIVAYMHWLAAQPESLQYALMGAQPEPHVYEISDRSGAAGRGRAR